MNLASEFESKATIYFIPKQVQQSKSVMKVKQISFSREYSKVMCKNSSQKINRSVIRSSSLTNSKPSSPYANKQSNKRLKYYSNRYKDSDPMIEEAHFETLRQEFFNFDDNRMKSYVKINSTHKKDAINLIAKKYYSLCKTQSTQKISASQLENNNQNLDPESFANLKSIIQVEDFSPTKFNHKLINISTLTPVNPQNIKIHIPNRPFNAVKLGPDVQNDKQDALAYPRKPSFLSSKSNNKILVPEERLSRHRFTKSSFSRISYQNQNECKGYNSLNINLVSPSKCLIKQSTTQKVSKRQKNEFHSSGKSKKSKRYVNLPGEPLKIDQQSINPYTKKRYLHVQLEVEKKQIKKIQKMIQKSDTSNMKQSIQVKTINPEANTILSSRTLNKTHQDKFWRKVKNLGKSNIRKQLKGKGLKNRQMDFNQIHGWEIDNKSIANDHNESI